MLSITWNKNKNNNYNNVWEERKSPPLCQIFVQWCLFVFFNCFCHLFNINFTCTNSLNVLHSNYSFHYSKKKNLSSKNVKLYLQYCQQGSLKHDVLMCVCTSLRFCCHLKGNYNIRCDLFSSTYPMPKSTIDHIHNTKQNKTFSNQLKSNNEYIVCKAFKIPWYK